MKKFLILLLCLAGLIANLPALAQTKVEDKVVAPAQAENKQLILWVSGDREVAIKMVFMYATNAKKFGWKDKVRIVIWGPSSKLAATDADIQARLKQVQAAGVEVIACKACADEYGVADKLSELGIQVQYAGQMLADARREGWELLSL